MYRENTPSNKTQVITKSKNMVIWEISASKQLYIIGICTEIKFPKQKVVNGKTGFFVTPYSVYFKNGF